jgi:hypothetical protein
MPSIAHLAPEATSIPVAIKSLESPWMLALMVLFEVGANLSDSLLSFPPWQVWSGIAVHNFLRPFYNSLGICMFACAILPRNTAFVAEFSAATTSVQFVNRAMENSCRQTHVM